MIVSVTNLYDKVSIKKSNTFINLCVFFSFLCDPQVDLFYPVNDYFIEGLATNLSLPILC